jgi:hypothetical protein
MSERSALIELAHFIGQSPLLNESMAVRNRALSGITARMLPRKRSVGELLAVVLAISGRTRRMAQPRVRIGLDVFAPGGARAIQMQQDER